MLECSGQCVPVQIGAMPFHALAICDTDESLNLAGRIFDKDPALIACTFEAQEVNLFTGDNVAAHPVNNPDSVTRPCATFLLFIEQR